MNGAIFFSSKYGSTEQYANWISEATGLPVLNVSEIEAEPSNYDFLILGSPIIYYKMHFHKWMKKNVHKFQNKPTLLFTVSGVDGGENLDNWIFNSGIPKSMVSNLKHVALRGRQVPSQLTWFDGIMLRIRAYASKDPMARKEELKGFDYMDESSIEPILNWVKQWQINEIKVAS